MRRLYRVVTILVVSITSSTATYAQSFSHCETIITKGLREYRIERESQSHLNTVYDNYCETSGSSLSRRLGVGIDTVVKLIPISLTGSFGSNEEAIRNFCKTYASTVSAKRIRDVYAETVAAKAYETFEQCVRLTALGVSIEHQVVNTEAVQIFFWAGVNRPVQVRGVTATSNISCHGIPPDTAPGASNRAKQKAPRETSAVGKAAIAYTKDTVVETVDSLGIVCQRSSRQSGENRVLDEGTIQVMTNHGPYSVFLPRDERLADNLASRIETELNALRVELATARTRLEGLKIELGPEQILRQFACGEEAKTSDGQLLVMTGSRDGTGCGVGNRNYVRELKLVIPAK